MEAETVTETTSFEEKLGTGLKTSLWFGKLLPRPDLVFICQMVVIYVVIGVSLFNLTQGTEREGKLWTVLLSSCLGYMLPNPKIEPRSAINQL